jgi:ABC-type multidrug transport system ATPase subunit
VSALLEAYGIPDSCIYENPIELPFTLKKRLSILLAAESSRSWLIFDEPTLGQDSTYRHACAELIRMALQTGRGVIVISHDMYFRSLFPKAHRLVFGDGGVLEN